MKVPTLVTGISTLNNRPASQRGFTLFEILVVVVIVIITVSAVVFSTNIGRGDQDLKLLGNDLGKLLHLIYQEAIFENKNFAISLNTEGYNVLEYDGENWNISGQSFYRKIKLEEMHESSLIVDNLDIEPVEAGEAVPHILILASGEVTPYEWQITDITLDAQITIQGDFLGKVTVLGPVSISDV